MTNAKVLVVEDNEGVKRDLCDFVTSNYPGVQCVGVASGEEAVAAVASDGIGLVLMDLGLPGMSGAEATRRIRSTSSATNVIIVSIHDTTAHRAGAVAAGAVGYVPKSALPGELRPLLDRYLGGGGRVAG